MIKNGLGFILKFFLVFGLLLSFNYTKAYASVYTVNDAGDSSDINPGNNICATSTGKCTLRAAIEEANAHPGPDQINIPAMTIRVNSQLEVRYVYGVDTSVTIVGAGQSKTIIDGQQKTRVFYFEARTGNHSMSNLTIQNGYNLASPTADRWIKNGGGIFSEAKLSLANVLIKNSRAYQGGGIYGEHSFPNPQGVWNITSLNLTNVTIQDSKATSVDGWATGGALFSGSLLTANGLYLYNNTAYVGAGLYQNSPKSVEIQTSTVTNLQSSGNVAVDGAGVANDLGNMNITNATIENNQTTGCRTQDPTCEYGAGAGIYNNEGAMNLNSVSIKNNTVNQKRGYGGAIYSRETITLTSVTFDNNKAAVGAAIFNGNYDNVTNSLTINTSTFKNNVGRDGVNPAYDSMGGAIYNIGTAIVTHTLFDHNTAHLGGAIFNYKYMSMTDVSITNGQATYGSGIFNGNYASAPNSLTLINANISNNTGTSGAPESIGGGIFNYNNGYLNLVNATIADNQASRGGGLQNSGAVDIVNTLIGGNVGWVESPDCRGQIISDGNNLVQNTNGCSFTKTSSDLINVNPGILPLITNSSVYYHPLAANSPAINTGVNDRCPNSDIIGRPRPLGLRCDIGSFEWATTYSVYMPYTRH